MNEIIKIIKEKNTLSQKIFAKHYPSEYQTILEYVKQFDISDWSEIKYVYVNQLKEIPKCKICDNKARFFKSLNRYMDTCCRDCDKKLKSQSHKKYWSNMDEDEKQKRLEQAANVKLEKYGYKTPFASKEVKEKIKDTLLERYNVDCIFKEKNLQNKIKAIRENNRDIINSKISDTWSKLDKEQIKDKRKQTLLERYGVDNYSKTKSFKNLYNNENFVKNIVDKNYNTKKVNNTFNISSQEDKIYNILLEKFNNIIRQYKDERYPYCCDFYIPDIDLFIEYNGSWTHGFKPFNENDNDCIDLLNKWKTKTNSKYYQNAIYNWTVLDVTKRNIAKQNKLNYLEFFNMEQFNDWFKYI